MAAGRCAYNEIVAEPLTKENQEAWFVCVKNFLKAQDLWDVINGTAKPCKRSLSWRRKNAKALHIMQISCTPESFSHIKRVSKAKAAWHILNRIYTKSDEDSPEPPMAPQETEEEEVDFDVKTLYKTICDNKWTATKAFLEKHPNALNAKLTSRGKTALHVAALFGHVGIVEELVKLVSPDHLEIVDESGRTPLLISTYTEVTQVAKCMVNKNKRILSIPNRNSHLPVTLALATGHKEMASYLYSITPLEDLKPDKGFQGPQLLSRCFKSGDLNMALDLLQRCEELLFKPNSNGWTPIEGIAAMPLAFPSGSQLTFWEQRIYNSLHVQPTTNANNVCVDIQQSDQSKRVHGLGLLQRLISYTSIFLGMKEIYDFKLLHAQAAQILSLVCKNVSVLHTKYQQDIVSNALFRAAREGIVEFVVEVAKANPELILYNKGSSNWNTFFFAIGYRQAAVFNLIHGLRFKDVLASRSDNSGNNMLHVAGMLAPSSQLNRIPGAALQMQREVQWFKEVESVVPPALRLSENNNGKQPEHIFKESHKELRKEGEEWIKGTASSCSVVGALVVTIMFAAVFTVPGGNNQESGYPIFVEKKLFMVFIISDALSLFSSTTSVLMFLGILTSRYLEEDFLKSLPKKLIIGLSSLFLSIATMMVAFSATILIMLEHRQSWALLPIIMLASVPVTLFVLLQFPLLVQIVYSTYGPSIFHRNVELWP